MVPPGIKSEIRDSTLRELLEKVRKQNYGKYLQAIRLDNVRQFHGASIRFDFPVTALIGPNGGGKSTILGASACIYDSINPRNIFKKSRVGDESMNGWRIEYEVIEKTQNPRGTIRADISFDRNVWTRATTFPRMVSIYGINRTVPAIENPLYAYKKKLSVYSGGGEIEVKEVENIDHIKREAERVLGKTLENFKLLEITFKIREKKLHRQSISSKVVLEDGTEIITRKKLEPVERIKKYSHKKLMYVGGDGTCSYSEFNFGSGEASVIRMVADIESQPNGSLILIEEVENGLHPIAVNRLIEYFIDTSKLNNHQIIFTTHSDYALVSLPPEAIWASLDGKLQQGKLSIEVLRAVSGRIDKRIAIFVEDDFAVNWIMSIVREAIGQHFEEIGIYSVNGDGNAVKIHNSHNSDPSIKFRSICFIDGDSHQKDEPENGIFRLPGTNPEETIFTSVLTNLDKNIALLTAALQRPLVMQEKISGMIRDIAKTNRDPHILFSSLGEKLGFIPDVIVRGAFIEIWIQENPDEVHRIIDPIVRML